MPRCSPSSWNNVCNTATANVADCFIHGGADTPAVALCTTKSVSKSTEARHSKIRVSATSHFTKAHKIHHYKRIRGLQQAQFISAVQWLTHITRFPCVFLFSTSVIPFFVTSLQFAFKRQGAFVEHPAHPSPEARLHTFHAFQDDNHAPLSYQWRCTRKILFVHLSHFFALST